jgi:predicted phosphodiesterase
MKKLNILFGILFLAGVYFLFQEVLKPWAVDYYSDNYIPRPTAYPATEAPDQICLTWAGAPATTQAINWRAATSVKEGFIQYRKQGDTAEPAETAAAVNVIEDDMVENDLVNHRFSVNLTGLQPGTAYEYRVGSKAPEHWSEWHSFSTGPAASEPFSFIYWGDVQNGYEYWGTLVEKALAQKSDPAFHILAGDLINNGDYRDQWDGFFNFSNGAFASSPLVPCLGNHDYDKKDAPQKYLDMFMLAENGPEALAPERAFSYTYGDALFVILDSNRELHDQTAWLEEQLANSDATWKFVMYHHPAYVSKDNRENEFVRDVWGPVFDRYEVDIAFQGHDHAYLRTKPMRGGKIVGMGEGVIYIVAVAGNKYYEQEPWDYTEVGFVDTSTYQIIDIDTDPNRLTYRAYDETGAVRDEFVLEKP